MTYWANHLKKKNVRFLNMEEDSSSETAKQTPYITQCKNLEDDHFSNIRRESLKTRLVNILTASPVMRKWIVYTSLISSKITDS